MPQDNSDESCLDSTFAGVPAIRVLQQTCVKNKSNLMVRSHDT